MKISTTTNRRTKRTALSIGALLVDRPGRRGVAGSRQHPQLLRHVELHHVPRVDLKVQAPVPKLPERTDHPQRQVELLPRERPLVGAVVGVVVRAHVTPPSPQAPPIPPS